MYYVQKEHHNLKIKSFTNNYKNKIDQSLTKGTQPFCVYRIRDSTKTAAPHRYIYINHIEQLTQTLLLIAVQLYIKMNSTTKYNKISI